MRGTRFLRFDEVPVVLELVVPETLADILPHTALERAVVVQRLLSLLLLVESPLADEAIFRRDAEETGAVGQNQGHDLVRVEEGFELLPLEQIAVGQGGDVHHVPDLEVPQPHGRHLARDAEVSAASLQLVLEVAVIVL